MQNYLSKTIKYGLYASLLLPLLFTPFTFFSWGFGKTIIFQIVVEILLFLYFLDRTHRKIPEEASQARWLNWSIVIFLALLFATSLTGVNASNSFWGNQARSSGVFTWLHFGAWYFLLRQTFKGTKEWAKVFVVATVVAIVVGLTVLLENWLPNFWQSGSGGGILGNRSFAASYLVLALGISAALATWLKSWWRYFAGGISVLFLAALWITGNRGAFVGLVLGVGSGLILALFLITQKKAKSIVGFALAIFLFVCIGGLIFAQTNFFKTNLPILAGALDISRLRSGTAETRLMAWNIAWQGILEKPLLGWGIGNYDVIFNKYYNPEFLKHSFSETVWDKPHNWLLEVGTSAGVAGFISYLGLVIIAGYYLARKTPLPKPVAIVLLSTLIAYLVQSIFLFETVNTLLLFFLILAFIASHDLSAETVATPSKAKQKSWTAFLLVPGALLLIFFLFEFNYLPLKSSYYLNRAHAAENVFTWSENADKNLQIPVTFRGENGIFLAERFVQLDKADLNVNFPEVITSALKVAKALDESSKRYPDNPLFPVWAGQIYMVLGEKVDSKFYQEAEQALLKASSLSPQKQDFLILLGRLYLLKKDFAKAIEFQKRAVAAAPNIGTSHWFLGLTYVASGDARSGLEEIDNALKKGYNLTTSQKLYVIDLYAGEKRYDKVVEWYRALSEAEPEKIDWYIKLATAYAVNGQKAEALRVVKEAIKLYPPLEPDATKFIKQYKLE